MTEPASQPSDPAQQPAEDAREPDASPQRRLVESISAYEVDPPAPVRVREQPAG